MRNGAGVAFPRICFVTGPPALLTCLQSGADCVAIERAARSTEQMPSLVCHRPKRRSVRQRTFLPLWNVLSKIYWLERCLSAPRGHEYNSRFARADAKSKPAAATMLRRTNRGKTMHDAETIEKGATRLASENSPRSFSFVGEAFDQARVGAPRTTGPKKTFLELLTRHLNSGSLIIEHGGAQHKIGTDNADPIVLRVHRDEFFRRVLAHGNLGMGEAFMANEFEVADDRLVECLTMLCKAGLHKKLRSDWKFLLRYGGFLVGNRLTSPATNVRRHYDIGEDLFDAFLLDRYQVYSCGYAHAQDDDADLLQQNKLGRICRKLEIEPGQTLLDIGCGKGGMLIHAALEFGARGVGVTNSIAHHRRAEENAEKYGVSDRVRFVLGDYRDIKGSFDRIVSVGMLEHVRKRDYPTYFQTIAKLLAPRGRGLVHVIGCNTNVNRHDPFIQRYIFPGSDTPKLSAMTTQLESNSLAILDVENMARHYAITLRRWLEAFQQNQHTLDPVRYDTAFKRMWQYYLSCGIASATAGEQALYQVLFTSDYHAPYRLQRI